MVNGEIEIPWGRWFDKVYCCWYMPSKGRYERLKGEMERLGLWGSPLFELRKMVPQRMEEVVLEWSRRQPGGCTRLFAVGLGMENIRIMKEALLSGYRRIMIIEDDAAFLKDKGEIVRILDAMPEGFGMVQMDKAIHNQREVEFYDRLLSERRINEHYVDCREGCFTLSTCNVYTREGIEKVVAEMEAKMAIIDCVAGWIPTEPAVAVKNLAVQIVYGKCNNKVFYDKLEAMHSIYKLQGLDYADYEVPEGYGYGGIVPE